MCKAIGRFGIFAALLLTFAGEAEAQLKLCNKTSSDVSVAVAYPQGGDWESTGWFLIKPGICAPVTSGILWNQYYYFHAYTADGKSLWAGPVAFCVHSKDAFKILGKNDCKTRNYESRGFIEIDTGDAREFTMNLDPAPGSPKAETNLSPGATNFVG